MPQQQQLLQAQRSAGHALALEPQPQLAALSSTPRVAATVVRGWEGMQQLQAPQQQQQPLDGLVGEWADVQEGGNEKGPLGAAATLLWRLLAVALSWSSLQLRWPWAQGSRT